MVSSLEVQLSQVSWRVKENAPRDTVVWVVGEMVSRVAVADPKLGYSSHACAKARRGVIGKLPIEGKLGVGKRS